MSTFINKNIIGAIITSFQYIVFKIHKALFMFLRYLFVHTSISIQTKQAIVRNINIDINIDIDR